MFGYSARDVARMLELSESQVRSYARSGFVHPHRGPRGALRFSFQDLVLLRTAAGLVRARVPARRVRRALSLLREQLPEGRTLAGVRVSADGTRVVVRDGGTLWHPESGQALFDFEVADLAERVAPLLRSAAGTRAPALDAEAWYEWGCDLEDGAPGPAREAYQRALELDPGHAGAHLNMGRLLHESRELERAEEHYRLALQTRPDDAIALFNLGVVLEDRGRSDEGLAAYERSIAVEPTADAHFNAARLCEKLGRRAEAVRHLAARRRFLAERR